MPNMCIAMGKSLAVFRDSCLSLHNFLVKNAKNRLFWRKNDFECIFDRFEVQLVTVWSSRLEKTPNTFDFAYGRFFTQF